MGASTVAEPPPASGLVATGDAATLDAIGWIALAKGTGNDTARNSPAGNDTGTGPLVLVAFNSCPHDPAEPDVVFDPLIV